MTKAKDKDDRTSHTPGEVEVEFLVDHVVKDKVHTVYEKGQTVKMNESSAEHFCSRGLAIRTADKPPEPKPEPKPHH